MDASPGFEDGLAFEVERQKHTLYCGLTLAKLTSASRAQQARCGDINRECRMPLSGT